MEYGQWMIIRFLRQEDANAGRPSERSLKMVCAFFQKLVLLPRTPATKGHSRPRPRRRPINEKSGWNRGDDLQARNSRSARLAAIREKLLPDHCSPSANRTTIDHTDTFLVDDDHNGLDEDGC
jgi:hypothetical protein